MSSGIIKTSVIVFAASLLFSFNAFASEEELTQVSETMSVAEAVGRSVDGTMDVLKEEENAAAIYSELMDISLRQQIVAYAKQFVGGRYRYGGTSLTGGVDCSGYVMKIFQHFGINTGRDSRTQAAASRSIGMNEIRPGDLVFYSSGGRIDHVAIYIGEGQIVHASNERTGITISRINYRTPVKIGTFL